MDAAVGILTLGLFCFGGCSRESQQPVYPEQPLTTLTAPSPSPFEIHGLISRVQRNVEWRIAGRSLEVIPEKGTLIWLKNQESDKEYPLLLIESGLHKWSWRHSETLMQGVNESAIKASWVVKALVNDPANLAQQIEIPALGQWKADKIGESEIF